MTTIIQMTSTDLQHMIHQTVCESLRQFSKPDEPPVRDSITIQEVSEMTGLKVSVIYQKTCHKQIPYAKFGKRLVFSRKAISEWMESRTVQPVAANDKMVNHLAKLARAK